MNAIRDQSTVPLELAGERLDKAAAQMFEDFSRAELTRFIKEGALTVDGRSGRPKDRLIGGELLVLEGERPQREDWDSAEEMALDIIFEDAHVIVLNKPAGLVVHPGAGNRDGTLVNGLLFHKPSLAQLPRAGVVHRLDKDTSGIMVVAASTDAYQRLGAAIRSRRVQRGYVAVCEGRLVAGADIDQPIGRDPRQRLRQAVREDGKPAFTSVRVLERYRAHTLVAAQLHSGRTHQIRVHMRSIGHALVGDRRYGARGNVPVGAGSELIEILRGFGRQALHAQSLGFEHPVTAAELDFQAPWAADFENLVEALRADNVQ